MNRTLSLKVLIKSKILSYVVLYDITYERTIVTVM